MYLKKNMSLYNENSSCLDNILSECNVAINKECSTKLNNNPNHLHQITSSMVKNAVSNLKRGKTDILNNIFSDSFIEAPTILYEFLANIYTIIIKHGISNDVFNFILFSPLIKDNRKAKNNSDNYRAIALNSCFCKIFDYIIIKHFNILKSNDRKFA